MQSPVEKGQLKWCQGAMKKLLEPYTVSIDVNSPSTISDENWISIVWRVDNHDQSSDQPEDAKEKIAAFQRALKNDEKPNHSEMQVISGSPSEPPFEPPNADIMTPIRLMIEFAVSHEEFGDFQDTIQRSESLPLNQQLSALAADTASKDTERQLIIALFPNAVATAPGILQFQSVLELFNEQQLRIHNAPPIQWKEEQVALSMMMYAMAEIRNREMHPIEALWKFVHFLRRYCIEKKWNGMKMQDFWCQIMRNRAETYHFGQKMTKKICDYFEVDMTSFQMVMELLSMWYLNALRRFELQPVILEDCSVEDVDTLFTFEAGDDDDEKTRESDREMVDGVFSRFEKRGRSDLQCMIEIAQWKEKIVEWVQTEKVDGKKLTETADEELIDRMEEALSNDADVEVIVMDDDEPVARACGVMLRLCKTCSVYEILRKNANRASILDEELWTDCKMVNKPLFNLDPEEFWQSIGQWILEDTKYNNALTELKRIFMEYGVNGAVVHVIWLENSGDLALIQNIVENDMQRYLTGRTVRTTIRALKRWLYDINHVNALFAASADDVAQLILQFPIQNLKDVICNGQMDGKTFLANPSEFQKIVQEATGWEKTECTLLSEVMLRRISLSEQQILNNLQRLAMNTKGLFPESLITKMKNRLLFDGNLENVHCKLRVHAVIEHEFRVLIMDILDEMLKSRELFGVNDEDFIPLFFDTISGALVMKTEDGDGQLPWRCPCCGDLNVHKVIGYHMDTNISICSLCAVTQCEAITMALKDIPLPFQHRNVSTKPFSKNQRNSDVCFIYERAKNKRFDLHCRAQRDADLCPALIRIASLLMDQKRHFNPNKKSVKELSGDVLRRYITTKEYKGLLLECANNILIENEPDNVTAAMELVEKRLDDNADGLGDVVLNFGSNGNRRGFTGILKKDKAMKGGTAGKIYKAVQHELGKMVFLLQIKEIDVDELREHVLLHHLQGASIPKGTAMCSFFREVVHHDDSPGVIAQCIQNKSLTPDEGHERLQQLNTLYMFFLGHFQAADTKETEEKESDGFNLKKYVTDVDSRERKGNEYGFGTYYNYIHMIPTFTSVREELMCNDEWSESHDTFMSMLLKAIKVFDGKLDLHSIFVSAREYGAKHGILRNEDITVKHVMCIILYTDLGELSLLRLHGPSAV